MWFSVINLTLQHIIFSCLLVSSFETLVGDLTRTLSYHLKEFRERNYLRKLLEYRTLWSHVLH